MAFARSKEEFLREFLSLEGGVPSHDTFSRLFRLLDLAAFSTCLTRFAAGDLQARGARVIVIAGPDDHYYLLRPSPDSSATARLAFCREPTCAGRVRALRRRTAQEPAISPR